MPPVAKLVRMRVADGRRADLAAILEPVRAAAAEDPGTEAWSLHGDRSDPDLVFIYERYRDQEALEAHDQLPVLREAIAQVGAVLQGPPEVIEADVLAAG
jgi:(4S)-4-hydroxy-5-phosphonooxypentane-2,3-dione isomerase